MYSCEKTIYKRGSNELTTEVKTAIQASFRSHFINKFYGQGLESSSNFAAPGKKMPHPDDPIPVWPWPLGPLVMDSLIREMLRNDNLGIDHDLITSIMKEKVFLNEIDTLLEITEKFNGTLNNFKKRMS